MDDRTARAYGLDTFDERPSYGFGMGAVSDAAAAPATFSPILDDDELISDETARDVEDDDDDDLMDDDGED